MYGNKANPQPAVEMRVSVEFYQQGAGTLRLSEECQLPSMNLAEMAEVMSNIHATLQTIKKDREVKS
jgi:hypothetical protein